MGASIANGVMSKSDYLGGGAMGAGIGLVLAGIAGWFLGRHFNVGVVEPKVAEFAQARGAELQAQVESGTFNPGPGWRAPTSLAEARDMSGKLLDAESAALRKMLTNRHHIWFLPAQYLGVVGALVGIGLAAYALAA